VHYTGHQNQREDWFN